VVNAARSDDVLDLTPARRRAVTIGVLTGTALAALEATVVGAAMPTVVASLGGLEHYSWVFSAYLLTSTVTVPVWGKLSDLYGRRRLYQVGIALFLLGSGLSGAAQDMEQLVAFRALQGVGAGALIPIGLTILADLFDLERRARVQGLFSGVWGVASVVGPPVGGFITEHWSWRWVFYLNLPIGLAAAVIIGLALREPRRQAKPSIDYAGAALLTCAMTLLMLALFDARSARSLLSPGRLAALLGAAAAAVAFLRAERRAREPILPLTLLRNRVVAVAVICGFLAGGAMFGAISYVPLYVQATMAAGAAAAGASLTPLMLAWVTFSVIGGRLLLRIGYRWTVLTGLTVMTAGFVLLTRLGPGSSRTVLYADMAIVGAGLGLAMLTLLIAVQQAVPRTQLGVATSVNQLARALGGTVAVAVMGVMLTAGLARRLPGEHDLAALVLAEGGTEALEGERALVRAALVAALREIFVLSTVIVAAAVVVAAIGLPRAPDAPPPAACDAGTGERVLAAELATLDPDHEPAAVRD
jgi:EmrB/QacA subfamily drug resistance transporter